MTRLFNFFSFILYVYAGVCAAQQLTITGDVRDKNTHQEIAGVNVFVKNTQIGTITDANGNFSFKITEPHPETVLVFRHIAYDVCEIKLDSLRTLKTIYLQPRVIPLQNLHIEAQREELSGIDKDLPQAITIMRSENFRNRGFVDAADYLSTDQSIQVEEQISGKKTIGIRGSNPDDVLILYNGIKMNNAFDNTFDLSLVDLEDIERLEIIRGSQTSIFGAGGFAGVVNIVPKIERDYTVRFQQRFGTYNSGNWGLALYKNFHNLHPAYSYRKGSSTREFSASFPGQQQLLINDSEHHTASIDYKFDANLLSASYIRSNLGYDNQRYRENIENLNQLYSIKYSGKIYRFSDMNLTASRHLLEEDQHLNNGNYFQGEFLTENIESTSNDYTVDKKWRLSSSELFLSYQLEDESLTFHDQLYFPEKDETVSYKEQMSRRHHGFLAIAKIFNQLDSLFIPVFDVDFCVRSDLVTDTRSMDGMSNERNWDQTTLKFSSNLEGRKENLVYHGYLNYGKNIKFPTMLQQVSATMRRSRNDEMIQLEPEISAGYDLGLELSGDTRGANNPPIDGWQLSFYLFKNYYTNKLRASYTPGFPLAFYDNVLVAEINGVETKTSLFLLNKKLAMELGLSKYSISDKAAFPFKYDNKLTFDVKINHEGYNFQLHAFQEGEQVGWIRDFQGRFSEVNLPSHFNMDVHLKKNIEIKKLKFLLNTSIRNLLNEDVELVGLALRDRRYYLTMGVEY
jgi:outer membrane receptor for ferrienterochelin and colicin